MPSLSLNMTQTQQQRLIMTPQMQQSIQLLQMTSMDLDQMLGEEMEENPFLEIFEKGPMEEEPAASEATIDAGTAATEEVTPTPAEQAAEKVGVDVVETAGAIGEDEPAKFEESDVNWENCFDSFGSSAQYRWNGGSDEEQQDFTEYTPLAKSLYDHLKWQLDVSGIADAERPIAQYLISNIDENGYLRVSVEEAAEELRVEVQLVKDVLEVVQEFDPSGIGARDLAECLRLQLEELEVRDSILYRILDDDFDMLQRRKFRELARKYQVTQDHVREVLKHITRCDPKPGRSITKDEVRYITPDVYVKKIEENAAHNGGGQSRYMYYINEGDSGMVRVNNYYRNLMQRGQLTREEDKAYAKEKYNAAVWLIRNLEKRKNTILRVTEAIMEHQKDFLEKGIEFLRPLTLKEIAEIVSLHESTVARVTSGKYVDTPRGVFELKFFFSSHLGTDDGDSTSSRSVKEALRVIISEEDPKKPLSDLKITKILNERGIQVARRTVAKYREQLKILPAKHRRER